MVFRIILLSYGTEYAIGIVVGYGVVSLCACGNSSIVDEGALVEKWEVSIVVSDAISGVKMFFISTMILPN